MIQSGIQTGIDVAPQVGLNPTSGFPTNLSQWLAAGLPDIDALWLFDEASGDFRDRIGNHDFSLSAGTITRRIRTSTGYGISLDSSDASLTISSTDFMDAGTDTDISVFVLGSIETQPATTSAIVSKRVVGTEGWQVYSFHSGTTRMVALADSGVSADSAQVTAHHIGKVAVVATLDWSALRIQTGLGSAVDSSLGIGDTSNSAALTVGANAAQDAFEDFVVDVVAVKEGTAWTADERQRIIDYYT